MLSKNIEKMKTNVADHIAADQVVQDIHWENNKSGFIGGLAHSFESQTVTEKYGMPKLLVGVCQNIFENLPEKEAVQFFADIPIAIGLDGKDLSLVQWQFLRDLLSRLPSITITTQKVINGVSLIAGGRKWDEGMATAVWHAARSEAKTGPLTVAWVVNYAAWEAARAMAYEIQGIAYKDHDPVYTAHAAHAAAEVADDAEAERRKQAQSIIQLLKDAPIKAAH